MDYLITKSLNASYILLWKLRCLRQGRYYFREKIKKKKLQHAAKAVSVLWDDCLLFGFEQQHSPPAAQAFKVDFLDHD